MSLWEFIISFKGFISIIVVSLLTYVSFTWKYDYFSKRNIPYLKPLPIFGNTASIVFRRKSFSDFILDVYKSFEGHRFVGVFQSYKPSLMIRDPEILKEIFVKDFVHFTDRVRFTSEDDEPLFSANLFLQKGCRWYQMRKTLNAAFIAPSNLEPMYTLMIDCGYQLSEHLQKLIAESGKEMIPVEMNDIFTKYTCDMIATCAFGINCNSLKDENNTFFKMGKDIANFSGFRQFKKIGFKLCPKLMQFLGFRFLNQECTNFLLSMVKETIRVRKEKGIVRPDMIHLLMKARKGELELDEEKWENILKPNNNGTPLSDLEIASQAIVFFLAGFETVSSSLCFTSLLLALHPEEQKKLQNEIDRTLEQNGGQFRYWLLRKMPYLNMVISESLRLYPPIPNIDRECTKTYTIPASDGSPEVTLKPKDSIWIPIYGIHHDPKYFPDPEKFYPERFNNENIYNLKPAIVMPFGAGPRECIGMHFAFMELKIALVSLLSKFTFEIIYRSPVPIKISKKSLNMTVDGGIWIGLKPRT